MVWGRLAFVSVRHTGGSPTLAAEGDLEVDSAGGKGTRAGISGGALRSF